MSNPFVKTKPKKKKIKVKSYNKITYDIQKANKALNPLGNDTALRSEGPQPGSPFKKKTNKGKPNGKKKKK